MSIRVAPDVVGIGKNGSLAFAQQTDFKTENTEADDFFYLDASYDSVIDTQLMRIKNENMMGSLNPTPDDRGREKTEGRLNTYMTDQWLGKWAHIALGKEDKNTVQVVPSVSGMRNHIWTHSLQSSVSNWNTTYWSVRQRRGQAREERFIGATATNFGIKGEVTDTGSQIMFSSDLLCYRGKTSSETPATYDFPVGKNMLLEQAFLTIIPYNDDDADYTVATNMRSSANDANANRFELKSFDLMVEYNMRNEGSAGSYYIDQPIRTTVPEISFSCNFFQDMRWIWEQRNFNYYNIALEIFNPTRTLQSQSASTRGMRFDIAKCALSPDIKAPREAGLSKFDLSFTDFQLGPIRTFRGAVASTNELYRMNIIDTVTTSYRD